MIAKEIAVIRGLVKQHMEYANSERHIRMRRRFRDTNDLRIVRPQNLMVWAETVSDVLDEFYGKA